MVEVIRSYIQDGIGIIQLAALLVALAMVLAVWTRTKSAMATIGAMFIGALVLGFIHNAAWFGQRVADDMQQRENGAAMVDR